MIEIVYLGNGSSGNSTYFTDGTTSVLIDNGLPLKKIPYQVNGGILVTHVHVDHMDGVEKYIRKYGQKSGIRAIVDRSYFMENKVDPKYLDYKDFVSGLPFDVGTLTVRPIGLWHDEVCFSFMLNNRYIHVTDTGKIPCTVLHQLETNPIEIFYVESNYDEEMMEESDYDSYLKWRIKSRIGHLSNQYVIEFLNKNKCKFEKVQHIILGHLSHNTNSVDKLKQRMQESLDEEIRKKVTIGEEGTKITIGT